MADTEIVGTVSTEDGITWTLHEGLGATGLKGNTAYRVRPVGPEMNVTTQAPLVAPGFSRDPQITATSSTVGSTMGLDLGDWTGNPTPTLSKISWFKNGTAEANLVPNQNGATLATSSGFAALDDVYAGVEIQAVINGENVKATAYTQPFKLTAQQAILITNLDLKAAGQQSSVTFNTEIKGLPTITQGQTVIPVVRDGTTNRWLFIAQVEGPISISAVKDDWLPVNQSGTVAPAQSVLVERNYELMIDNDPGSEPLEIIEPQEYAGVYDISDATYTNGMRVLAPAVISRTGDIITATRDPLFSWLSDVEPVQFARAYYRGATPQTATLIAGTNDAAIYTIDPVLDGGKNVYRRDWIENAEGVQVAAFSNGIAVAAPANWWTPDSIVDVDFQNNRARINGVSYASIAEARTANAIKTSPTGVDYTDVAGLGASYVLAAKGITPNVTSAQILAAMDDGDDGSTNDEIVYVGQQFANSQHRVALFAQASASPRLSSGNGPMLTLNSPVRMAVRVKNTLYYGMVDGVTGASSNTTGTLPAVNRVTYGKRSVASELTWTGTVHRVVVINADLTNDQINALLA